MENQFKALVPNELEPYMDTHDKLYISEKLLLKISKYLEKEPLQLRSSEVFEEGWFNKKESYIQKRLKHKKSERKYYLGISNLYRSFNGNRVTRYMLYWLNERDVLYINKSLEFEPGGEQVPVHTLSKLYQIVNIDQHGKE